MGAKQKRQLRYAKQAVHRANLSKRAAEDHVWKAKEYMHVGQGYWEAAKRELEKYLRLDHRPAWNRNSHTVACTLYIDELSIAQMRSKDDLARLIGYYFADKLGAFHQVLTPNRAHFPDEAQKESDRWQS